MLARQDPLEALGPNVTSQALGAARQALERAREARRPPQRVAPYLAGGVQLEWCGEAEELRLLIHPDGVAEYLAHGQTRHPAEVVVTLLAAIFTSRQP